MLDFYFYNSIRLEDLKQDPNISIFHEDGDDRTFICLVEDLDGGGWLYIQDDYIYGVAGHDPMIPVAFYIYDKYNVPFCIDDCTAIHDEFGIKDYYKEMLSLFKDGEKEGEVKALYDKIYAEYINN